LEALAAALPGRSANHASVVPVIGESYWLKSRWRVDVACKPRTCL